MRIQFDESFELPIEHVFDYFKSPSDWASLYGLAGEVEDRGEGWWAVPLKSFPFPLVARNTDLELNEYVRWEFNGFWHGFGEVRFTTDGTRTRVTGQEIIAIRWLFFLSPLVEQLFLKAPFEGIWRFGWKRLHKQEAEPSGTVV